MKNKNTKLVSMRILVDDLNSVKRQLEEMAESGWMLAGKQGNRFLFGKFEGRKLNFAVELFDNASEFDTFPNMYNMEYIEYCEKAGWHYICSSGKVQFFYSEDLDLIPIETDDRMKFEAICKANRSAVRLWYLLLLMWLGKFVMYMTVDRNELDLSFFAFSMNLFTIILLIAGLVQLVRWYSWKKRCKRSLDSDSGLIARRYMRPKIRNILTYAILGGWIIAGLIVCVKFGQLTDLMAPLAGIVGLLIVLIGCGIASKMVRCKAKASTNAALQTVIPVLFGIVLIFIVVLSIPINESYEITSLPLTLEDLGVEASETYDTYHLNEGRFLLSLDSYSVSAEGIPEIKYDIYQTNIVAIYDRLLRDAENGTFRSDGFRFNFSEAVEIEGLKADDAYVCRYEDYYKYLFLYDGVIVVLKSHFAFSEEQLYIADNIFSEIRPAGLWLADRQQ